MKGLRWSLRVSVLGWIVYGSLAYAFADIQVIPAVVQSWMVIVGSILIVAGAESNTIATAEAAFSKLGTGRFSAWDGLAVFVSLLGGVFTPLIVFSTRQPDLAGQWRSVVVNQGTLILGCAGVLDFYGAVLELSLARRDYEQAMERWLEEEREYDTAHGIVSPRALETARIADFWEIVDGLNGHRADFDEAMLKSELEKAGKGLPSPSTVGRWFGKLGAQ